MSGLRDNFIWNQYEKTRGSGDFYTADDYIVGGMMEAIMPDGEHVYEIKSFTGRLTASRKHPVRAAKACMPVRNSN